jgi:hypothetical protein
MRRNETPTGRPLFFIPSYEGSSLRQHFFNHNSLKKKYIIAVNNEGTNKKAKTALETFFNKIPGNQ